MHAGKGSTIEKKGFAYLYPTQDGLQSVEQKRERDAWVGGDETLLFKTVRLL